MTKRILISFSLIAAFALGFALKSLMVSTGEQTKKATGIGGIFF